MNYDELKKKGPIAIDFDGVLHQYDGWKGMDVVDGPADGALDFVLRLQASGYMPFVHTTRDADVVKKWLKHYDFPDIEVTNIKWPAIVYIDDRGIRFKGDFDKLIEELRDFHVFYNDKKPLKDL